ncbi:MAG: redoxin domain-containing protein [Clostridiales bacterium]|nr:redoxin domain-containing protein [Clostridiales bacterium]
MKDHIKKGAMAPDFTLEDNKGGQVKLSDLRGKKVLLSWHPIAWTSECTDQMRALEANHDRFEKLNTVPLGMSVDPAAGKTAWAAVLSIRKTPLLADFYPHGKVAKDYGLFLEEHGMSGRANVLIDEQGKVAWVKTYEMGQLPDIEEVFRAIEGK